MGRWVTKGEVASFEVGGTPWGPAAVMTELGQSEATLSAVAIRALCLQANGGH